MQKHFLFFHKFQKYNHTSLRKKTTRKNSTRMPDQTPEQLTQKISNCDRMGDLIKTPNRNKVILVMISNKKSCLYFHFKKDFVFKLSESKKDYGLFWSQENKRWEFDTENADIVLDFLENMLYAEVLVDDVRTTANVYDENTYPPKMGPAAAPSTTHPIRKRSLFGINRD